MKRNFILIILLLLVAIYILADFIFHFTLDIGPLIYIWTFIPFILLTAWPFLDGIGFSSEQVLVVLIWGLKIIVFILGIWVLWKFKRVRQIFLTIFIPLSIFLFYNVTVYRIVEKVNHERAERTVSLIDNYKNNNGRMPQSLLEINDAPKLAWGGNYKYGVWGTNGEYYLCYEPYLIDDECWDFKDEYWY